MIWFVGQFSSEYIFALPLSPGVTYGPSYISISPYSQSRSHLRLRIHTRHLTQSKWVRGLSGRCLGSSNRAYKDTHTPTNIKFFLMYRIYHFVSQSNPCIVPRFYPLHSWVRQLTASYSDSPQNVYAAFNGYITKIQANTYLLLLTLDVHVRYSHYRISFRVNRNERGKVRLGQSCHLIYSEKEMFVLRGKLRPQAKQHTFRGWNHWEIGDVS